MRVFRGVDGLRAAIGEELGPTDWLLINQARIDTFAGATEDRQWIHVDPERAAAGPFGTTVAHGFLSLSLVPHFVNAVRRIEGVRMGVNYGLDRVRFPAPVPVGSRLRGRSTILGVEELPGDTVQTVVRTTIDIEGVAKPACVADVVSRSHRGGP